MFGVISNRQSISWTLTSVRSTNPTNRDSFRFLLALKLWWTLESRRPSHPRDCLRRSHGNSSPWLLPSTGTRSLSAMTDSISLFCRTNAFSLGRPRSASGWKALCSCNNFQISASASKTNLLGPGAKSLARSAIWYWQPTLILQTLCLSSKLATSALSL